MPPQAGGARGTAWQASLPSSAHPRGPPPVTRPAPAVSVSKRSPREAAKGRFSSQPRPSGAGGRHLPSRRRLPAWACRGGRAGGAGGGGSPRRAVFKGGPPGNGPAAEVGGSWQAPPVLPGGWSRIGRRHIEAGRDAEEKQGVGGGRGHKARPAFAPGHGAP